MTENRPFPKHYIWFAEEANRSAGLLLKTKDEELSSASAAISIGLSLHAIELCGKAMLRSLGHLPDDIRQNHKGHKILQLLGDVQDEISKHSNPSVTEFRGFLLHAPTINGAEFRYSIGGYLKMHFNQGKTAYPRNYLYPDNETFVGPQPISAIHVMAEYLITKAKDLARVLGHGAP